MRTIRFRGKQINGKAWIYGYYFKYEDTHSIVPDSYSSKPIEYFRVFPETIGQFTGLYDQHGEAIYEGDVIELVTECNNTIHVLCEFGSATRDIHGNEVEIIGFYFKMLCSPFKKTFPIVKNYLGKHDSELFEIIGNIHDNPELYTNK